MKLITEQIDHVEVLTEATSDRKYYYLEGIYLQSEVKNRNGRIYPKGVMESAVDRYMTDKVANRTAYGELGHPASPSIIPENISHLIEKLEWHGNDVTGKSKILPEGKGKIAIGIIEMGGRLGMSSRGLGSLEQKNGVMYVRDDLHYSTAADIVTDPSAPNAWVNGIMEGVEWIHSSGGWSKRAIEETQNEIKAISTVDEATKKELQYLAIKKFFEQLKF